MAEDLGIEVRRNTKSWHCIVDENGQEEPFKMNMLWQEEEKLKEILELSCDERIDELEED